MTLPYSVQLYGAAALHLHEVSPVATARKSARRANFAADYCTQPPCMLVRRMYCTVSLA